MYKNRIVNLLPNGSMDQQPIKLKELVATYICNNVELLANKNAEGNYVLRAGIILPPDVAELLLHTFQFNRRRMDDSIINIFKDVKVSPLHSLIMFNTCTSYQAFETLLGNDLHCIRLVCSEQTQVDPSAVYNRGANVETLEIDISSHILRKHGFYSTDSFNFNKYFLHLRNLMLIGLRLHEDLELHALRNLTHLDLSQCDFTNFNSDNFIYLNNLQSLFMFNVWPMHTHIEAICQLTELRALDISVWRGSEIMGDYLLPENVITSVVERLPKLKYLDISGTNLASVGIGTFILPIIPGIEERTDRPFDFLGLYGTLGSACKRKYIPAREISGNANENQLLIACQYYMNRPTVLASVLNDLNIKVNNNSCRYYHKILDIAIVAVETYRSDRNVQEYAITLMCSTIQKINHINIRMQLKLRIINLLLTAMQMHTTNQVQFMGLLSFSYLNVPDDLMIDFKRLVKCICRVLFKRISDVTQYKIAIFLLSNLILDTEDKQDFMLECQVLSIVINVINNRLMLGKFGFIMKHSWTSLLHLTRNCIRHCDQFISQGGIDLVVQCFRINPGCTDWHSDMLGLLVNIAEYRQFREKLMVRPVVELMNRLMKHKCSKSRVLSFDINYNAARLMSYLTIEDPTMWSVGMPSRIHMLKRIERTVNTWKYSVMRFIDTNTLQPLHDVLKCFEAPQAMLWALWTLIALIKNYPEYYCDIIEQNGILSTLHGIYFHPESTKKLKVRCQKILTLYEDWQFNPERFDFV